MKRPQIIIVGGGPAGLGVASAIDFDRNDVLLLEKESKLGGKLNQWHLLNPTFTPASQLLEQMEGKARHPQCLVKTSSHVRQVRRDNTQQWHVVTDAGTEYVADCVVFAGGFDLFEAQRKEELGYGLYPRVVTSADIEKTLSGQAAPLPEFGTSPHIGFVHCVGSRDAKCNNRHCSRLCCMTGVKQAIELKKLYPLSTIWNFYMDLRMFGRGYEELYLSAQQEYGIRFVRGRVSQVAENKDKRLMVKAEDTLLGKPIRGEFDLLVLLVGMEPLKDNPLDCFCPKGDDGFALDGFGASPNGNGIFCTGACKGPMSSVDAFKDGQSTALEAMEYIKNNLS